VIITLGLFRLSWEVSLFPRSASLPRFFGVVFSGSVSVDFSSVPSPSSCCVCIAALTTTVSCISKPFPVSSSTSILLSTPVSFPTYFLLFVEDIGEGGSSHPLFNADFAPESSTAGLSVSVPRLVVTMPVSNSSVKVGEVPSSSYIEAEGIS